MKAVFDEPANLVEHMAKLGGDCFARVGADRGQARQPATYFSQQVKALGIPIGLVGVPAVFGVRRIFDFASNRPTGGSPSRQSDS